MPLRSAGALASAGMGAYKLFEVSAEGCASLRDYLGGYWSEMFKRGYNMGGIGRSAEDKGNDDTDDEAVNSREAELEEIIRRQKWVGITIGVIVAGLGLGWAGYVLYPRLFRSKSKPIPRRHTPAEIAIGCKDHRPSVK
jgi:hypothetical protein